MKNKNEVIQEFNEIVNMTASDLEKWLKSGDSRSAGWPKDDGSGESVGHDSGRKIVEILKANPNKSPDKYTEDQIQHMRKVVAYWYVWCFLPHLPPFPGLCSVRCLFDKLWMANACVIVNGTWHKRKRLMMKSLPKRSNRQSRMPHL